MHDNPQDPIYKWKLLRPNVVKHWRSPWCWKWMFAWDEQVPINFSNVIIATVKHIELTIPQIQDGGAVQRASLLPVWFGRESSEEQFLMTPTKNLILGGKHRRLQLYPRSAAQPPGGHFHFCRSTSAAFMDDSTCFGNQWQSKPIIILHCPKAFSDKSLTQACVIHDLCYVTPGARLVLGGLSRQGGSVID